MSWFKPALRKALYTGILIWPSIGWCQEQVAPNNFSGSAPATSEMRAPALPEPVDWSTRSHTLSNYQPQTEGAFDVVGSQLDFESPRRGRPTYPYDGHNYWGAHDADPEAWGDLAELPYVQLGWFINAEASYFATKFKQEFNSGTLLDGVFPGEPVTLDKAPLDASFSPRLEIGYRYERGLGEVRFGYQYYGFEGARTLLGFDPGGPAAHQSSVRGHVFDLDICYFEFNAEGLPLPFHPIFKWPGRIGLGRPLTPGWFAPPLEMRIAFGGRGGNYYTESQAVGPTTSERVTSNFWGGGLHFVWDLNQRLREQSAYFWHARVDGSGIWGVVDQTFSRTRGGLSATGFEHPWTGVPTVSLELGLGWSPKVPNRNLRATLAYHYEQWFSFAQSSRSTADLSLNGIVARGEFKY